MPPSKVFLSPAFALSVALGFALAPAACSHAEPTLQGFDSPGAAGEAGAGEAGGSGDGGSGQAGQGGQAAQGGKAGQGAQGGKAGQAGASGGNQPGGSSGLGGASGASGASGGSGGTAGAAGGAGTGTVVCTSGQQIACACPGTQVNGVQVCKVDGTGFGACTGCPGGQGGQGGQGGSGATGGGGGSTAGTGGSSAQGGTGASGGSNPFGGGGSSGSSGSGGSSPTTCGGCQAQANQTSCSSPASLCQNDADCTAVNGCINACTPNDQACVNACTAAHEKGTNMLLAVEVCGCETGCSSLCSFCPGVSPQSGSCVHSVCKTGPALKDTCSSCVTAVCQQDPFCCDAAQGGWDITCVLKLDASCGCYDPYSACLAKKVWTKVDGPDCGGCLNALCVDEGNLVASSCDVAKVAAQCKASCGDDAACACSCQHGQSGNCGDAIAIYDTCAANNCAQACR